MKFTKIEIPKDSCFATVQIHDDGTFGGITFSKRYTLEDVAKLEGKFMDIGDLKGEGVWVWVTNQVNQERGILLEDYLLWKEIEKEVGNLARVRVKGTVLKTKYVTMGIHGQVPRPCSWEYANRNYQLPDRVQATEIAKNIEEINRVRQHLGMKGIQDGYHVYWSSERDGVYPRAFNMSGGLNNYPGSSTIGVLDCKDLSELKPKKEDGPTQPELKTAWEKFDSLFDQMFRGR